jgi:TPP-dependent pyruvate/acetoin dehydrogenase alpha subunit
MIQSNLINSTTAVELLRMMKRIRVTEETIAETYSEWKMRCPTHLCTGQEAVAATAGIILEKDDFVVSSHRAHGHYLAKGGDLNRMIAEIYGKKTGCCKGKGGSMHLVDKSINFMGCTAIVGGTIPIGVGLGLSVQLKGTDQISCIFFGDGATEEGVFFESLNFASLRKLPVLFICENNFFSVYSPLSVRQPKGRDIQKMVECLGVDGAQGDGNNPDEVYQLISEAVKSIRQKKEPRFLEFFTYRWREHCGPNFDNDLGYRTEKEFQMWKERDPIKNYQKSLLNRKFINNKVIQTMEQEIREEVGKAFQFAEDSPFPEPEDIFTDLYSEE